MKTYKGKYTPKNPDKYRGSINDIVYRSGWERQTFLWLDRNPDVVWWNSEEVVIPYICGTDNRRHRYFIDVAYENKRGEKYLIEIKPNAQTKPPSSKRRTKRYVNEAMTYVKNQSKWKYAEGYAEHHGFKFQIWTEIELKQRGILPKTPKPLKKLPPFKKKK